MVRVAGCCDVGGRWRCGQRRNDHNGSLRAINGGRYFTSRSPLRRWNRRHREDGPSRMSARPNVDLEELQCLPVSHTASAAEQKK